MPEQVIVGNGKYRYAVDKDWGRRAGGVPAFGLVSGIACDSRDRVYVFQRLPNPRMLVLSREGQLLGEWGEGQFKHPHGIFFKADELYLTDRDTQLVTHWSLDGKLLGSWGTADQPGAPGEPFNQPTHAFVTSDGAMFVSDGYGQHRVHRFGADGRHEISWGEKGEGPGQFALPHDVWVDSRDRVIVCDRENRRIQFFNRDGAFLSEWADLKYPMQVFLRNEGSAASPNEIIYLAEARQQISILTLDGEVLARWGSPGDQPDQFTDSPHSIWVDSRGDIYVSEVLGHNKLKKFVRQ
ncbi:MAG TPA: peptidyl-alpha-hydroxyglycine alpha-amidating lyase family protein [Chloroflexota bacterium]|nr:peptidyl-alpha-hydroxyglycine alpha-amidating lyase family protein [Chloroflexota bacterium]